MDEAVSIGPPTVAASAERPEPRLRRRAAAASLAVGVAAALILPDARAGLGLALIAVGVLAASVTAGRGWATAAGWRIAVLGAAALLAGLTPLLRDAGWLVGMNLSIATVLAIGAIAPMLGIGGMARSLWAFVEGLFAGPMAVLGATSARLRAGDRQAGSAWRLLRAGWPAVVLVVTFALLLASADAAFAELLGGLFPAVSVDDAPVRICILVLVLAVASALALLAQDAGDAGPGTAPEARPPRRHFTAAEWITAGVSLCALFAAFVGVQIVVLFGGREHVLETADLTYAEYARAGFEQLLIVAALVVAVTLAALRRCVVDGPRQRLLLQALLVLLIALTGVILVSALHRLDLYVDAFGGTRARLLGQAVALFVGSILLILAPRIWSRGASWFGPAVLVLAAAGTLAFTLTNPDARIAAQNVERFEAGGQFDLEYNARLSADATPELLALPAGLETEVLRSQAARLSLDDGLWGWNLSRERARTVLGGG